MVAIGQALMSRPTYLLLDEPASGVAPVLVDEIYDTVDRLVADGLGVVLVTRASSGPSSARAATTSWTTVRWCSTATPPSSAIDQINPILLGTGTLGEVPASSTPPGSG